jgi:hypothetical protein
MRPHASAWPAKTPGKITTKKATIFWARHTLADADDEIAIHGIPARLGK